MTEKVLLVDDEEDFLEVMGERLSARGIDVTTSISAEDALEQIDKDLFDAVILDLQMPGMNGIEALKKIKKQHPELQVILLTGHATVEKGVEAIKLGAMDFVEKPADLSVLGEKIKKAHKKKMLIVDQTNKQRVIDALKKYGF
jgi:DNA-binding NtrC family response regulator